MTMSQAELSHPEVTKTLQGPKPARVSKECIAELTPNAPQLPGRSTQKRDQKAIWSRDVVRSKSAVDSTPPRQEPVAAPPLEAEAFGRLESFTRGCLQSAPAQRHARGGSRRDDRGAPGPDLDHEEFQHAHSLTRPTPGGQGSRSGWGAGRWEVLEGLLDDLGCGDRHLLRRDCRWGGPW